MKQAKGLTLIEVLVALAIVAIAMTAIIKATAQNIRATDYLQTKTVATWVGGLVLSEVKLGLVKIPPGADGLKAKTMMLGSDWYWQVKTLETPNRRIKRIVVQVFAIDPEVEAEPAAIIQLDGYVYVDNKE